MRKRRERETSREKREGSKQIAGKCPKFFKGSLCMINDKLSE